MTHEDYLIMEIKQLRKLVRNLLVDNINFKNGTNDIFGGKPAWYFDPENGYDKTYQFVRGPLQEFAETINERLEQLEGRIK